MSKNQNLISFRPAQLHIGKECFVYYYVQNPATEKLERKKIKLNRIKTIAERRKFAVQVIQELNKKLYGGWNPFLEESAPRGFTPLVQVIEIFFKSKERELRKDSLRSYRSFLDIFVNWMQTTNREKIFSAKFDKLDALEFMEFLFEKKNLSNKTWNNYRRFFSVLSNWMVEHKYAAVNYFFDIRKRNEAAKGRVVIDHEIRMKIIDYLVDMDYRFLMVCLMVFHSLIRPKEIANLRPMDFNFEQQTIMISGSFSKNHNDRVSTIPNSLLPYLKKWDFNGAASNQYIFGEWMLPGTKPVDARRFTQLWDKLRKDLKLPAEMKLYSLRDSGIIQMLNDGISIEEVRKQADHSSLDMTTVYTKHANPNGSEQIKSRGTGF